MALFSAAVHESALRSVVGVFTVLLAHQWPRWRDTSQFPVWVRSDRKRIAAANYIMLFHCRAGNYIGTLPSLASTALLGAAVPVMTLPFGSRYY